jgi:hypothetical protein
MNTSSGKPSLVLSSLALVAYVGCASDPDNGRKSSGQDDGIGYGTDSMGEETDSDDEEERMKLDLPEPVCSNLECAQIECDNPNETTTLTGTVYDPSGSLPLYNVQVYIPNSEVHPIVDGLTCDQCDVELSGSPLVTAITDTQGRFVLENVPVGEPIPLVMQVGKWRRQVTIPAVEACTQNVVHDADLTRLPRSRHEGDLPRIALTTGSADPLYCLLRRLGIDNQEFGVMGSDARIHFYAGVTGSKGFDEGFGASPGAQYAEAAETLWDSGWENYDLVMLSCEGSTYNAQKDGHREKLQDYLDFGGRVFATHFHYSWLQSEDAPTDLASVASFTSSLNSFSGPVDIDTSFQQGSALADWMVFVDGSSPHGQFDVTGGRAHTETLDEGIARVWVRRAFEDIARTIYFAFNTPVAAPEDEQCGRMVLSDIHVSSGAGQASGTFPSACNDTPLTEQEKALIFMLFDLSACIEPEPVAG